MKYLVELSHALLSSLDCYLLELEGLAQGVVVLLLVIAKPPCKNQETRYRVDCMIKDSINDSLKIRAEPPQLQQSFDELY